ncbi:MAG: barstar family protein [Bacteriovorax sp.]
MLFKSALIAFLGVLLSFQAMASSSVLISGKEIKNREHMHELLAKQLNVPRLYNKTLDSLYDVLSTDFSKESIVRIKYINILKAKLGSEYTEALIQTIQDAAEDNSRVILVLE